MKKGPSHGARHGNTKRQMIYYVAHNAARKARKNGHKTIMDRFLNSPLERSRNGNSWKLVPNTSGKNGPMDQRDDYQEAKGTRERLCEEHGKGNTRIHAKDQGRRRRSQQFTGTQEGSERVDQKKKLEVVRRSINNFFILKLASSFTVEIFIME